MNKLGILTFHLSENYGAMLQSFALREAFIMNGVDAHIINYKSKIEKLQFPKNIVHSLWEFVRDLLGHRERTKKANKFRSIYLNLNDTPVFHSIAEIPDLDSYDKFVVGSDQVWNYKITEDPVYRLLFANDNQKKYSYAASIGANEFVGEEIGLFSESLKSFSGISVREQSAVDAIAKIGLESTHVSDPTLLLPSKTWEEILRLNNINLSKKNYVFCYVLPGNITSQTTVNLAKKIASRNGLDLVVVGERDFMKLKSSIYKNDVGVDEFVWYIKNAEFVVTNSFHGTCFSIIFHKNFITTVAKNVSRNNRIIELLRQLNLESQLAYIEECEKYSFKECDINFQEMDKILEEFRNKSIDYINYIITS